MSSLRSLSNLSFLAQLLPLKRYAFSRTIAENERFGHSREFFHPLTKQLRIPYKSFICSASQLHAGGLFNLKLNKARNFL